MIREEIEQKDFVKELNSGGYLLSFTWRQEDIEEENKQYGIGDQSDPGVQEIRDTWPYFAQGFCEYLIRLIDVLRGIDKASLIQKPVSDIVALYKDIHKRIDDMWFKNGVHAFLHHVHLIFGVPPGQCAVRISNPKTVVRNGRAYTICNLMEIAGLKN